MVSNVTIVELVNGSFLKARGTAPKNGAIFIDFGNHMTAHIPQRLVKGVNTRSDSWRPPLPPGFVEIKPAPGVTIQLNSAWARKASLLKG
jgi:hypothetical protein